jgi:hypothetical protein
MHRLLFAGLIAALFFAALTHCEQRNSLQQLVQQMKERDIQAVTHNPSMQSRPPVGSAGPRPTGTRPSETHGPIPSGQASGRPLPSGSDRPTRQPRPSGTAVVRPRLVEAINADTTAHPNRPEGTRPFGVRPTGAIPSHPVGTRPSAEMLSDASRPPRPTGTRPSGAFPSHGSDEASRAPAGSRPSRPVHTSTAAV